MNIVGKTALITGASRGIGKAISLELARQGIKNCGFICNFLLPLKSELDVNKNQVLTIKVLLNSSSQRLVQLKTGNSQGNIARYTNI